MNNIIITVIASGIFLMALASETLTQPSPTKQPVSSQEKNMQLGVFSVSLAVKDIKASKAFYEKLDFKQVGGKLEQNWVILQNDTTTIGLFQGMFPKNGMTFCPGWDKDQKTLKEFDDVREIQKKLKARGLKLTTQADEASEGPANFTLIDPDGNTILFDQHVPKPK